VTDDDVTATGRTDVGRVREVNEDDFLVGDTVVAVADGMGGHLAGEVASRTALEPLQRLDGTAFTDAETALEALRDAVVHANATVWQLAEDEPTYRGMGTTLTAALVEGRRLHLAHVGDSRAYLLRDGVFSQLTDDHTLVQHLVDEGQITRDEADSHPQRAIITRAIGVAPDTEVDAISLELEFGDQILLCSDGLTGTVDDHGIAAELRRGDDPDTTVTRLIEAANTGGGPDNITVVVLRYGPVVPAAAGNGGDDPTDAAAPVRIGTRSDDQDADWAGRLGNYGALGTSAGSAAATGSAEDGGSLRRTLGKVAAGLVGLAVLAALAFVGGRFLLDRSFYVGLDGDEVVIYQGVDVELGPLSLDRIVERTDLRIEEVATYYRASLEDGRTATDLPDARRIVDGAPRSGESDPDELGDEAGADGPDDATGDDPAGDGTNAAAAEGHIAPGSRRSARPA
jgi:protein phosphatase